MPPTHTPKRNTSAINHGRLYASNPKKAAKDAADLLVETNVGPEYSLSPVFSPVYGDYHTGREAFLSPLLSPLPEKKEKKKNPPKPVLAKGEKEAFFYGDDHWKDDKYRGLVGTSTRKITFGSHFVMTDSHIRDIINLGSRITGNLTEIIFQYVNVNYDAHNDAKTLTDPVIINLAAACPKLKKIELPGTALLTDASPTAFFDSCPNLTQLTMTAASRNNLVLTGSALTSLLENPQYVPKLKKLRIAHSSIRGFMKAVKDLTRGRETLTVELVKVTEKKNWGDWDMLVEEQMYKKGRKVPKRRPRGRGFGLFDDDIEFNNYRMTDEVSAAYLVYDGYY